MRDPRADFVSGFSSTPIEVALAIASILAFVLFLSIYFIRQLRIEGARRAAEAAERYREYLENTGLTNLDRLALENLARELPPSVPAYRLFEEQGAFNRAATAALEAGTVEKQQVAALRVKLGFSGGMVGNKPRSSTEIPPGSPVEIQHRRGRRLKGRVLPHTTGSFRVELLPVAPGSSVRPRTPPTGARVTLFYQSGGGIFTFVGYVIALDGAVVEMSHSEDVRGRQRRQYARRPAEVSVVITPAEGGEPYVTVTEEVGAGGATIRDEERRLAPGTECIVKLRFSEGEVEELRGTVLRRSEEVGDTVHVAWTAISDAKRDKIYRFLFRGGAVR